jgi:DNA helicase-2/ATP-dependent DNA helicase PcrA
VHNLADSVSFGRVINTPTRGIGKKTEQQFYAWATANGWMPSEAMLKLVTDLDVQHPFNGRAFNALANFGHMFHAWYRLRDEVRVSDLMDAILEQTDYRSYVDDGTEEGRDRWANIMELRNVAAEADDMTLSEFIEQVALVSDQDDVDESQSRVTLLTLHAAKGLEFPVVFLTGLEDGVLPHSRSLDDGEEMAEERRLFYVGITRAKDRLYLSHAFRRTFFGDSSVSVPSRFLKDIPVELLDGDSSVSKRYNQATTRATNWQWSRSPQKPANSPSRSQPSTPAWSSSREKPLPQPRQYETAVDDDLDESRPSGQPQYKTGERVSHAKFGTGTVIESKWVGNDEEVTVAFPGEGIKRLVASFAKLEKK